MMGWGGGAPSPKTPNTATEKGSGGRARPRSDPGLPLVPRSAGPRATPPPLTSHWSRCGSRCPPPRPAAAAPPRRPPGPPPLAAALPAPAPPPLRSWPGPAAAPPRRTGTRREGPGGLSVAERGPSRPGAPFRPSRLPPSWDRGGRWAPGLPRTGNGPVLEFCVRFWAPQYRKERPSSGVLCLVLGTSAQAIFVAFPGPSLRWRGSSKGHKDDEGSAASLWCTGIVRAGPVLSGEDWEGILSMHSNISRECQRMLSDSSLVSSNRTRGSDH